MSGIYGMVRYDGAPVTAETLAPMAAAMSFWGPDGHGQWCGDSAGLGHLMLHVTPESLHERLPASIRVAPHLVITADARIDNRDELFDALGVAGPGRDQTPDSSLILLAYERWGQDCVKRLLGDFAFAIWDGRERKLFCARDPFGCMPFVYHHDGKRFMFASDVKGVLARVESPRLNEPLLAAYLQMSTYNAEKRYTFFEDVVKLPQAHALTVTAAGVQISRYWSPEDAPGIRLPTDADYAEQMRQLFQQAVECRLRSAFPIGSHLSGGLDSSAVSIAAARALRGRGQALSVYSWSPAPEPDADRKPDNEHVRIEAVCRAEGLTCQYFPVTPQNFFELFQTDFTLDPIEMLARERNVQTRALTQGVRVILSGWGGDEAVSHRAKSAFTEFLARGQWSEFRLAVGSRINAANEGPPLLKALRRAKRLSRIARDVITSLLPDLLYSPFSHKMWLEHESKCIRSSFARLHRRAVRDLRGPGFRFQPDVRSTICHFLEYGHISKRLEDWSASGARHRLVYRYPMLDRRLIEFTLGVPTAQLCSLGPRLAIFRRAVTGLLPTSCDWDRRKTESRALMALKNAYFKAHKDWAAHIIAEMAPSPAMQFVDPRKISKAVQIRSKSGRLAAIAGVREAFGCYVIGAAKVL